MLNELRIINFGDCLLRSDGAKEMARAVQEHLPNLEVTLSMYIRIVVRLYMYVIIGDGFRI